MFCRLASGVLTIELRRKGGEEKEGKRPECEEGKDVI
jgi:hypothetical protein